MNQEYYMGLDMGTGSLGWAITDTDYHILRRHGKALWGVRLFESALTAEERRSFRIARRRLDRRNWRIQILQELFSEEISKVDLGFFQRMKESKYYPEDKKDINGKCPELPYALFVDKNYTDKEYHREYPTIYHLRKMLMETEEMPDIRLVYLGLHHMMKHRGHFLLSGDISKIKEFKGTFLQLEENLKKEELNWTLELSDDEIQFIENTLKDRMHTKSVKKSRLIKQLNAKTTCEKAILNLISGGSVKLSDIFENSELDGCENPKISFSDTGYDDYIGTVEADLVEQYYIIESAKAVYDWSVLVEILGDSSSISEAKVKLYEKHKADLRYLKKIVRKYLPLEYKHIFIDTEEKLNNYVAYIGMTKKNGKKNDLQSKKCSKEEFYDFLKKNVIKKISDQEVVSYLEKELEQGTFLPKQVNKENSVIPYQVHMYELRKILDNLSGKSSFMQENKEKILQLFEFRIPYYVGPLGRNEEGTEGKFTWAVRKNNEKIYPWNFKDVIDIEESAEKFIRRMTNKCTYMLGEDVLPKDSLLYSKEESDLLESYLKEIAWNDGTNREGHAAKVYFNALFGLEFTRTEDNLINAALNYGYSIILSAFTREIVANGYITQLGVFHDNMFNQFNLASDLMEPFRILVDRQVLTMKLEQFEHEEKMQLVNVLNQEVQIDGKIQYVNNAIKIYCKSIFDALSGDDSSLIRFYRIEL